MTQVVVATALALTAVAVLAAMSMKANRRFADAPRLPMQWWLDESVTWSAPRMVALAFTPVLAAACLGFIAVLTVFGRPQPGQEGLVLPVDVVVALFFVGFHALHLWLMQRTVRK